VTELRTEPAWYDLEGTANTRDLGGLPTPRGPVRPGVLIRSDNLQGLSATDVRTLVDRVGVRTVLDLRTDSERAKEGPGPLREVDAVRHVDVSFIPDTAAVEQDAGTVLPDRWAHGPVHVYLQYLRDRPASFAQGARALLRPGGMIVHCAAGKDRTGVFVALMLDSIGTPREAIVADYALSNERIERVVGRLRATGTYAADVERIGLDAHRVNPDTMVDVLATVDSEFGGSVGYLRASGLQQAEIDGLRSRLVGAD